MNRTIEIDVVERVEKVTKKAVACPHCGKAVILNVTTAMHVAHTPEESEAPMGLHDMTEGQREVLETAKRSGLFGAWLQAFNTHLTGAINPAKADRGYLNFWGRAQRRPLTPDVCAFVAQEYSIERTRDIFALQFNHVTALMANQQCLVFVPTEAALGRLGKNVKSAERRMPSIPDLTRWIRSRYGYVPADARLFAAEMRKKSVGEFSTVRL